MTRSLSDAAPAGPEAVHGGNPIPVGSQHHGRHKGLRGRFAVGFLILSAVIAYGAVLVLIDKWYKGGSLGIL